MARRKSTQDRIKEEVKLELTPMIDVTFLILIFFMCTLKFKTLEGKLVSYLPTDKGLSNAPAVVEFEDAEIILKIEKKYWDSKSPDYIEDPMAREVVFLKNGSNTPFGRSKRLLKNKDGTVTFDLDPKETFDDVMEYLLEVRKANVESKAKINAYARTPHVYVVHVLNMMIEAEFTDISYSGIPTYLVQRLGLPAGHPDRIR
ncbi:MAG: biopolymer transporter ExbD [Planctomycetes bacterium]|nr:biopolymer transporter ExbD [Planctomycetota bacterium]